MRSLSVLNRVAIIAAAVGIGFVLVVFVASEWSINQTYDFPLVDPEFVVEPDAVAGERMAKIVGCWAGCHGIRGEGGIDEIPGIFRLTAPPLGSVIPAYSDAELVRLILHGVKRNGQSAIGMTSYSFWSLGDADIANIIHFLRLQSPVDAIDRVRQIPFASRLKLLRGEWSLSADQVDKTQPRWGNMPRTNPYERGRYLASIVCAECHGVDYLGDPIQGGPPLSILAIYDEDEFAHLMKTGVSQAGFIVERMSWLPDIEFKNQDIVDLYEFLTRKDVE